MPPNGVIICIKIGDQEDVRSANQSVKGQRYLDLGVLQGDVLNNEHGGESGSDCVFWG
jgi:hypothetical protein